MTDRSKYWCIIFRTYDAYVLAGVRRVDVRHKLQAFLVKSGVCKSRSSAARLWAMKYHTWDKTGTLPKDARPYRSGHFRATSASILNAAEKINNSLNEIH